MDLDSLKFLWAILLLPLGWLFFLLNAYAKDHKGREDALWKRYRAIEDQVRCIELKVHAIEQKYITDVQVREIIKEAFEPIRIEYAETKAMIQGVSETLKVLEIEIAKLTSRKDQ